MKITKKYVENLTNRELSELVSNALSEPELLVWEAEQARRLERHRRFMIGAGAPVDVPLPGFEAAIEEGKAAVAADKQIELSEILASPKADIEAKAGAIETCSPLFRGHGPQGELF